MSNERYTMYLCLNSTKYVRAQGVRIWKSVVPRREKITFDDLESTTSAIIDPRFENREIRYTFIFI